MNPSVDVNRIHPVTDFVRNYKSYLSRIRDTRRPEVLTVNGVAECVLVDAASYQEMHDAWEEAKFIKAVNEGIESMKSDEGQSVSQTFSKIRKDLEL